MKKIFSDKRIIYIYVVTILFLMIGVTYALQSSSLSFGLSTALVRIDEDAYGSTTFDTSNLDFRPILDSEVETSENEVIKIDFQVGGASTNNNDHIIYDIALNDLKVNCALLSPYIKWKLMKNGTEISNGSLDYKFDTIVGDSENGGRLVLTTIQQDLPDYNATDKSGYDSYMFYMWFSDSCQSSDLSTCINNGTIANQSALIGQNLSGKVEVELYTESKKELVRTPGDNVADSLCQERYLVNLNLNGGTLSNDTSFYVVNGSTYETLPTPIKTYTATFNTNGGTDITTVNNTINNDIEEQLKFNGLVPKVQFLTDTTNQISVDYTFEGWYKDSAFTEQVLNTDIVDTTKNFTLYAKWSGNSNITLPNTTQVGHEFEGWYSDSNYTNKVGNAGDSHELKGNTVLYGKWKANIYTVTFDNKNATSAGSTSVNVTYGSSLPSITVPSRSYTVTFDANGGNVTPTTSTAVYTFNGYYTEINGNGIQYYDTNGIGTRNWELTSDITLYANWTSTPVTLATPSRTGYTFVGWYTSNYKDAPLNYYADAYSDLKNAFGYDQLSLYNHWINNGQSEGRSVAPYMGNITPTSNITIYGGWIDNIAPSAVTITYNSGENSCSWKNNYNMSFSATETGSGIDHYESDGNGDGIADFTLSSNWAPWNGFNSHTQRFRAVDKAGNAGPWSENQHIHMDTESPSVPTVNLNGYVSNSYTGQNVVQTPSATDNVGIAKYQYCHDNVNFVDWPAGTGAWTISWDGQWTFYVRAVDHAGNAGPSTSYIIRRISNYSVSSPSSNAYNLSEAISIANSGTTITLLNNISDDSINSISKNVTLNLNNKTLTRSALLQINSGYTVTISGGTLSSSAWGIDNYGTLKVTSGTIAGATRGINNRDSGILYISGGTVSSSGGGGVYNYGQFELSGGTISAVNSCGICNGDATNNYGVVYINGAAVIKTTGSGHALQNRSVETWPTVQSAGKIHYDSSHPCAIHVNNGLKVRAEGSGYAIVNQGIGTVHFTQNVTGYAYAKSNYTLYNNNTSGSILIYGGTVYQPSSKFKTGSGSSSITITNKGTTSASTPSN